MEAGDCLFIPTGWYHQVSSSGGGGVGEAAGEGAAAGSEPSLNFALNVWWNRPRRLDWSRLIPEPNTFEEGGSAGGAIGSVARGAAGRAGDCPELLRPIPLSTCTFLDVLEGQGADPETSKTTCAQPCARPKGWQQCDGEDQQ